LNELKRAQRQKSPCESASGVTGSQLASLALCAVFIIFGFEFRSEKCSITGASGQGLTAYWQEAHCWISNAILSAW